VPAPSTREISRPWTDRLASYLTHRNDEHLEALVEEARRYAGLHLENDLSASRFWSKAPLSRRIAVLLYLVDRGIVERKVVHGRRVYQPVESAESWVVQQSALGPYLEPTLELVAALRRELSRASRHARS
jgi:hypothetical protein